MQTSYRPEWGFQFSKLFQWRFRWMQLVLRVLAEVSQNSFHSLAFLGLAANPYGLLTFKCHLFWILQELTRAWRSSRLCARCHSIIFWIGVLLEQELSQSWLLLLLTRVFMATKLCIARYWGSQKMAWQWPSGRWQILIAIQSSYIVCMAKIAQGWWWCCYWCSQA